MNSISDPFRAKRQDTGIIIGEFQGECVPMILRHKEVRSAAKDWMKFSSDSPFRVPIPSEEDVRTMRQLPIETDPPDHTDYRAIIEPIFRRPKDSVFIVRMGELIDGMLADAMGRDSIEIVRGFALPLQSRALALLLNVPQSEADIWISWGIHVFHDGDPGQKKESSLEAYLHAKFDAVAASPGDDFFSVLTRGMFRGRPLTRVEMMGFANLTFAGGRDTIIHTVTSVMAYLSNHPEAMEYLREDPTRIVLASEEFFRVFMPLTHIGRVCPVETDVHGVSVKAGGRVSLCWASANHDESAFESPGELRLDRKPNPHLSFGFGPHLCLGALHARMLLRTLLLKLTQRVEKIAAIAATERIEKISEYERTVGYDSLSVSIMPLSIPSKLSATQQSINHDIP